MNRVRCALCLAVVALLAASCAPKKVVLYDTPGLRGEVVAFALGLAGKPYRSGGKGPDGFDCSGLVQYAFRHAGVSLPPSTEGLRREGGEIRRDRVRPGDLVFFAIKGEAHVGIMVDGTRFVHASKSRGVAVDDVDSSYWRPKIAGFRSIL